MVNANQCIHRDALTWRKLIDVFVAHHSGDGWYIIGKFFIP
jgi:hypothetical protein